MLRNYIEEEGLRRYGSAKSTYLRVVVVPSAPADSAILPAKPPSSFSMTTASVAAPPARSTTPPALVSAPHTPVLPTAVVSLLTEDLPRRDRYVLVDGTLGAGGHSALLLRALRAQDKQVQFVGADRDESALALARSRLQTEFTTGVDWHFMHSNYKDLSSVLSRLQLPNPDLMLLDIGVSTMQLSQPHRGFAFSLDGPIDMRMDQNDSSIGTALELIDALSEPELADIIFRYGEDRYSRRLAATIKIARVDGLCNTTGQLADLCSHVYPPKWVSKTTSKLEPPYRDLCTDVKQTESQKMDIHPATRTFQALRIAVNDELGALHKLLLTVPSLLRPGSRLGIISFHSLEDRIVKLKFHDWAAAGDATLMPSRGPVLPTAAEVATNPAARSAKLRVCQWLASTTATTEPINGTTSGGDRTRRT